MKRTDSPPERPDVLPDYPPAEVMAGWLGSATLAPSMHNTQPWRFRVSRADQTIELYADPSRMLKYGDPQGRAVHIACGAALFNLRLAVAVGGREPVVRLLPDWFEETPQLAVLSTAGGTRKDWMHAGQALQRVLLTATAHGIAAAPLTQPLETADAWLVRDPREGVEQPQMILRLGYGLPVSATPRRPVGDVLDERQ